MCVFFYSEKVAEKGMNFEEQDPID